MEIFEARVLGRNLFTSEVYTVFKLEYFLYIIQIMLQYIPSFNKVCYTLDCKAAFYKYIKLNIMQVRGNTSRIYALGGSFILSLHY